MGRSDSQYPHELVPGEGVEIDVQLSSLAYLAVELHYRSLELDLLLRDGEHAAVLAFVQTAPTKQTQIPRQNARVSLQITGFRAFLHTANELVRPVASG